MSGAGGTRRLHGVDSELGRDVLQDLGLFRTHWHPGAAVAAVKGVSAGKALR